MLRVLAVAAVAVGSAGCVTNQIALTYNCIPSGAILVQGDRVVGVCPTTLYYTLAPRSAIADALGPGSEVVRSQGVSAKWASGATAATSPTVLLNESQGYSLQVTLARPVDAEGLETDLKIAAEFERNAALRAQAQAATDQAWIQQYFAGYLIGQSIGNAIVRAK